MRNICFSPLVLLVAATVVSADDRLITYPAPEGTQPSPHYQLKVNGKPVFVYTAEVLKDGPASFAYFDFTGKVDLEVKPARKANNIVVRPLAYNIIPETKGGVIRFDLHQPANISVEPFGPSHPLFIFANPIETDRPDPKDPNVLYFGPGVHEVGSTELTDGKMLYIAGGAIVKGIIRPGEKPVNPKNWAGNKTYKPLFAARKQNGVTIRGRGIIDTSGLPWHAKSPIRISDCTNVLIEGIIVKDSPSWDMPVFKCKHVIYRNIKQICHRENSDGINICNSQDVLVEDCFLRNNDDEICVKTPRPPPAPPSKDILVKNCVIWNDRAIGLGITYETRVGIENVRFENCHVIHDTGLASLSIRASDSGLIRNIRFENCRVENSRTPIALLIVKDFWGHDKERGNIRNVVFKNCWLNQGAIHLSGFDAEHRIDGVVFENVLNAGKPVTRAQGNHVRNVRCVVDQSAPPTAPQGTTAQAVRHDRVELTWQDASDPESGVLWYRIYRDGEFVGQAWGTRFIDLKTSERTSYTYALAAVNGVNLEGPKSKPCSIKTPADETPPRVAHVDSIPGDPEHVRVRFSKAIDPNSSQDVGNYAVSPTIRVKEATLQKDGKTLLLAVTPLQPKRPYTLSVHNVMDRAPKPQPVAAATTVPFTYDSGLAAYWPLDNKQANDAGLGNRHGAAEGNPIWTTGQFGGGIQIDPADGEDYVEFPGDGSLEGVEKENYTLSAWFKPLSVPQGKDSNSGNFAILVRPGYHLGLLYTKDKRFVMYHWLESNGCSASSSAIFEPGTFYHIAGVVDRAAGTVTIYVNGKREGRRTFEPGAQARKYDKTPWRLGISIPNASNYRWPAHGCVDDVRIYRCALDENQIQALANSDK